MNGRLPTHKMASHENLTIEVLKSALRDVMWERSAILGPPEQKGDWPDVFVLMPFAPFLTPVYEVHMKRTAARLNLRIGRADNFFGPFPIMRDIWSAIHAARVVVADCTGRNPNVFYEIGLAHAIGRQTILIAQSLRDVPFDLRSLRVIIYDRKDMRTFEKTLLETIKKSC